MNDSPLWSNLFKKDDTRQESIYDLLKKTPIFADLDKKEMAAIEHILHRRSYEKDELIFKQGEPGLGMYLILTGSVRIVLGEEQKLLALLSRGDFFGEMSLLLASPRTAGASAAAPTELVGFFQPDLMNVLDTHPRAGNKILFQLAKIIAERLRQTSLENQQLREKLNQLEQSNSPEKKTR